MSEVRNVQITGGAVDHYRKERAGGVTRRRRRVEHEGGDAPPGAPLLGPANMGAVKIIGETLASGGAKKKKEDEVPVKKVEPVAVASPVTPKPQPLPQQPQTPLHPQPKVEGKIILKPAKKTPKKIVLGPPAIVKTKKRSTNPRETHKVRVQLSGFKKRVTRAKAISKESSQKPLTDIRKELEDAKLIKPIAQGGKERVPEAVLRSMHRDYLLLRNRAL
jgi:hypothetical protein